VTQPAPVDGALAAVTRSLIVVIVVAVNTEIGALGRTLGEAFEAHPVQGAPSARRQLQHGARAFGEQADGGRVGEGSGPGADHRG